ncbi:MAG: hypothetical protein IJQ85_10310 [Selenomonadaceae bacterium]|nr:hypothetical protein [Selenomonadaceae bacterium]
MVDSGCKWQQLAHDFPAWQTVYTLFRRFRYTLKKKNSPRQCGGKLFFDRQRKNFWL